MISGSKASIWSMRSSVALLEKSFRKCFFFYPYSSIYHHTLYIFCYQEEKVPYTFWIKGKEVKGTLLESLRASGITNNEAVVTVVYLPQALFRVSAVTRCASEMPGCSVLSSIPCPIKLFSIFPSRETASISLILFPYSSSASKSFRIRCITRSCPFENSLESSRFRISRLTCGVLMSHLIV